MGEEMSLVSDLAVIFIAAGVMTVIFKALKQPLILGYIVAGLLVGSNLGLIPLTNETSVEQWAEIGIIFLLFGLGLEFSFKKLLKVGGKALIMVSTIVVGMTLVGYIIGQLLGWSQLECLFLGSTISMTSSTIVIKTFGDMGLSKQAFTQTVFGTLIMEDVLGVILMVLLSTMAVSKHFSGAEMVLAIEKLLFYIILWFVMGISIIPTLLSKGRRHMNQEMLTVVSIGLCFMMVIFANMAGFSSALGAFIMGSMLAETLEAEQIEESIKNVKDLFGAVFFVSVGMMVDPRVLVEQWKPIALLTPAVLIALPLFAMLGSLLAKNGTEISVKAGMSLAQAGEFGFIVASLGISLGVMSPDLYPIIVSVSIITTFTSSYYIKWGEKLSRFVETHLPARYWNRLNPPTKHKKSSKDKVWRETIQGFLMRYAVYLVLLTGLTFAAAAAKNVIVAICQQYQWPQWTASWIGLGIFLLAQVPFLIGLISVSQAQLDRQNALLALHKHHLTMIVFVLVKYLTALSAVMGLVEVFFGLPVWLYLCVVLLVTALFVLVRKGILGSNAAMEAVFFRNLKEKETYNRKLKPITSMLNEKLGGHDIVLQTVTVSPNSEHIGKQLRDLPLRAQYGVNIVKIVRGVKTINIPGADEYLYPADKVSVIGRQNQVDAFMTDIEEHYKQYTEQTVGEAVIGSRVLTEQSPLVGKTLRSLDMRSYGCMLVGVIRDGHSLMNPNPDFVLQTGDTIWVVGEPGACEKYV